MDVFSVIVMLHIGAGRAPATLQLMTFQSDHVALWNIPDVSGAYTHAVQGRYTLFEGWCALLDGSGLSFEVDPSGSHLIAVRPEEYPGEHAALCQDKPNGWGPDFIHPPEADWK